MIESKMNYEGMYLKSKCSLSVKPGLVSIAEELIQFQKLVVENLSKISCWKSKFSNVCGMVKISF